MDHAAIDSGRPTRIVVDLDAIAGNLDAIGRHTGVPVMAVVKANAYGHGLVPLAKHLEALGVAQLGVAFLEEGIALRQAGVRIPILVMGGIFGPQAAQFIAHGLEATVSSLDKLRQVEAAAEAAGRKAVVHLKIDTGMERIGVHSYSAGPFIEAAVASRWCTIKGVYSHLACADDPSSPMTALQVERFAEACAHFERLGAPSRSKCAQASAKRSTCSAVIGDDGSSAQARCEYTPLIAHQRDATAASMNGPAE
jgi:alanine racemase